MAALMTCRVDARRRRLFGNTSLNGIDYVEVADDPPSLAVYFFGDVPQNLTPANIRIDGGRRITGIKAIRVDVAGADSDEKYLDVELDADGDFSTYTLRIVETHDADGARPGQPLVALDPRYDRIDFRFRLDCPSAFDCAPAPDCPADVGAAPDINYLAKDYESFRQLMLDRLAVTMPSWRERHVPDLGITLVEIMAYVADQLSYYQDAVATEAYLDTARTRISVRRHARLVDYRLHEGCNARAWLAIACTSDIELPPDAYFVTGHADIARIARGGSVGHDDLARIAPDRYEAFEQAIAPPKSGTPLIALHSTLRFYTWGDEECCLPKGATTATLIDPAPPAKKPPADGGDGGGTTQGPVIGAKAPAAAKATAKAQPSPARLRIGDVLIFEEVLGPRTAEPADADPTHRHAVRLTSVDYANDPLDDTAVIHIEWSRADALPFPLCLSACLPAPDCRCIEDISVARGNVILVDHGTSVCEPIGVVGYGGKEGCCDCDGAVPDGSVLPACFVPDPLAHVPLTFRCAPPTHGPAVTALVQDPREATAAIRVTETSASPGIRNATWTVCADLLESSPDDRDVVVEVDDDGRGHLRFGDGTLGRQPDAGSTLDVCYRFGEGSAGNVPADAIAYIVFRKTSIDGAGLAARNPLPASGGIAPETLAEAKLAAPHAFRNRLMRAVTADDYATLAGRDARLQRANARLAWNGSWYEADVAIDPLGTENARAKLVAAIDAELEPYRRVGHDLAVQRARYVPLAIALDICVQPDYLRGHVAAALADALGDRRLPDGTLGFFHPDRLTFGDAIYASDLIAAAQNVDGVQSVTLTDLRRADAPRPPTPPDQLNLASFEIAQVDNDPDFPEHGNLTLCVRGGR